MLDILIMLEKILYQYEFPLCTGQFDYLKKRIFVYIGKKIRIKFPTLERQSNKKQKVGQDCADMCMQVDVDYLFHYIDLIYILCVKKKFIFRFNLQYVEYRCHFFVVNSLNDSTNEIFFAKIFRHIQTILNASTFFAPY